jgi:hypothetical protein
MPPLENARQETFAQNVASGMSLVEAYEEAGYDRSIRPPQGRAERPAPMRRGGLGPCH